MKNSKDSGTEVISILKQAVNGVPLADLCTLNSAQHGQCQLLEVTVEVLQPERQSYD